MWLVGWLYRGVREWVFDSRSLPFPCSNSHSHSQDCWISFPFPSHSLPIPFPFPNHIPAPSQKFPRLIKHNSNVIISSPVSRLIYFTAQAQFTYQIWPIFGLHWISWLSLISRVSGCIVGNAVKFYLLLRWKSHAHVFRQWVSATQLCLWLYRGRMPYWHSLEFRMTNNFSVIRYCKQRLKIDIIAITRNQRFAQQTYSELCESWGSGIFPQLIIPIPSYSRIAIPIPIPVPKLHIVHSHSHGIPMGKWETGIPTPDEHLYGLVFDGR